MKCKYSMSLGKRQIEKIDNKNALCGGMTKWKEHNTNRYHENAMV